MMMVTLNCDWTTPEDEVVAARSMKDRPDMRGISAIIGTSWRPICPANENLPQWLQVYG